MQSAFKRAPVTPTILHRQPSRQDLDTFLLVQQRVMMYSACWEGSNSEGRRLDCQTVPAESPMAREDRMTISQEVGVICQAFADGLKRILGEKLHGAYVYGAAAFPDAVPTGDIDFHVILTGELTDTERSELDRLHQSLAEQFPPLGGEMDGYYILLKDAMRESPPRSQMWRRAVDDSWALHCQHIRAGRCIALHGPDPREIYRPSTWPLIENALRGEVDFVQKHLREHPDYCILNLCRLIYSFETRDVVVSKAQAADWACGALPEWRRDIELAMKSYARQATLQDRQFMLAEAGRFFEFARRRIEHACQERAKDQVQAKR